MKRVVKVRVLSTEAEAAALAATLLACNRAASWLSAAMYTNRVHSKHDAQKRYYAELKQQFHLSAQPAIRVIGKVADAYTALRANIVAGNYGPPGCEWRNKVARSRLSSAVMRRSRLSHGVCRGRSPTRWVGAMRQCRSGPPTVD